MDRPRTYNREPHPTIKLDLGCTLCELGVNRERHNNNEKDSGKLKSAVGGAGPDDLSKVKLILLGDYNGHYENQSLHPQVDIREQRAERTRTGLLNPLNSGAFIRMALNLMYGLDTYNDCWFTNAVKCNPEKVTVKEVQHMKVCASKWLKNELQTLDEQVPTGVPILIAGNVAFKAVQLLYKDCVDLQKGLNNCRRRDDIFINGRPVVFTENPAKFARAQPRIESKLKYQKGKWTVGENEWLYPVIPGSPVASAIKDLSFLKKYLRGNSDG